MSDFQFGEDLIVKSDGLLGGKPLLGNTSRMATPRWRTFTEFVA